MPVERTGTVAGVVLAGGSSTRMGENKLLFDLDGESVVRRVVRQAAAAGLDPVIVVLGHEAELVRRDHGREKAERGRDVGPERGRRASPENSGAHRWHRV